MSDIDKARAEYESHVENASGEKLSFAEQYAFDAGYRAALPQWVPIADIPDEWKDGRELDFLMRDGSRRLTYSFQTVPRFSQVTHAMLPPALPIEPVL